LRLPGKRNNKKHLNGDSGPKPECKAFLQNNKSGFLTGFIYLII